MSGSPDPTYAYPLAMRIALGLGAWGMALLVSRMTDLHGAAAPEEMVASLRERAISHRLTKL